MKLRTRLNLCLVNTILYRAQQLENQVLNLSPNDFSCIEDYLSKFKTLRTLCEEFNINIEEQG
jgi:predicted nuclease of restriction endonuclease-like RecB superfamily